jgi:adenylosuccinate synthase
MRGGHNAGHTVIFNGNRFVLAADPLRILRPGKHAVIGSGVVVDPAAWWESWTPLPEPNPRHSRLHLSNRAHLIFLITGKWRGG